MTKQIYTKASCPQCDAEGIILTNSDGGVEVGPFTESYECADCGEEWKITGKAQDAKENWQFGQE